jgi:outer membrane protein assembly factor BamE (lipoprotein component of BamABCDE complex)
VKSKTLSGLLAPSLLAITMGCNMQQTTHFDAETWKAQRGAAADQNRRGTMVEALEQAVRVGMRRNEVIALLGEPDASDAQTQTDTYELGVSPLGIDEEYYQIAYRDGMVASLEWRRR